MRLPRPEHLSRTKPGALELGSRGLRIPGIRLGHRPLPDPLETRHETGTNTCPTPWAGYTVGVGGGQVPRRAAAREESPERAGVGVEGLCLQGGSHTGKAPAQ